jgi:hypothetical protein
LEILTLKPHWNSNALLAIAVGTGIAGSLDLAQACILSAGRTPLVIAAGLLDGRTMRNERFAGKCLNRILKLDFYRTLRIAPTRFCPLSAPDVEVARKLIECCEKASPAVNRLGEKENTLAQALHVKTRSPETRNSLRSLTAWLRPIVKTFAFATSAESLPRFFGRIAMRPLWETSHHIS